VGFAGVLAVERGWQIGAGPQEEPKDGKAVRDPLYFVHPTRSHPSGPRHHQKSTTIGNSEEDKPRLFSGNCHNQRRRYNCPPLRFETPPTTTLLVGNEEMTAAAMT